jgi:hypothetical protein
MVSNKPTEMLGSRNQANLIVSGGNSSHNSKTEYGFQSLTCLFLHFNPWNLMKTIKMKNPQDGTEAFWARVDDIARERLDAEDKLHLKAADTLHRELLQELDR